MKKNSFKPAILIIVAVILVGLPVLLRKTFGKPIAYNSNIVLDQSLCVLRDKDENISIFNPKSLKMPLRKVTVWPGKVSYLDSAGVFERKNRHGYYDIATGEVFVRAQFSQAWPFSEGLAAVVKNGMIGFYDRKGNVAIDFRFPYYGNSLTDFQFKGGHCAVADRKGRCGVIDTLGHWVIEPNYEDVAVFKEYAIVTSKGIRKQVGFDGRTINSFVMDNVKELTYLDPCYSDDDYEYADYNEDEEYDNQNDSSDGDVCTGLYIYRMGKRWGLMNASGERLTEPLYAKMNALGENLIKATLLDNYSVVLLNFKGEVMN